MGGAIVDWSSIDNVRKTIAEVSGNPRRITDLKRGFKIKDHAHRKTMMALAHHERIVLLSSPHLVQCMHAIANDFVIAKKRVEDVLAVYDAAILAKDHYDLDLYSNALLAVLDDTHKLGVMKERAARYLETCLPYGPRNPKLFHNAVCARFELGDAEGAIELTRDAVRWGYRDLPALKNDKALAPLAKDPRFRAAFTDRVLLAERKERCLPAALEALAPLQDSWAPIDLELFASMQSREETHAWFAAWSGNKKTKRAETIRPFAQDGTGGLVAFWRTNLERELEKEPVAFFGSEGAFDVVARDLADLLVLMAAGIGPMELVENESTKGKPIAKLKTLLAKHYPKARTRTPTQVLADARKIAPAFKAAITAAMK